MVILLLKFGRYLIIGLVVVLFLVGCRAEIEQNQPQVEETPTLTTAVSQSTSTTAPPTASATVTTPKSPDAPPTVTPIATAVSTSPSNSVPTPIAVESNLPGALIRVGIQSSVGVLLDEFPEEMRDDVAEAVMEQSEAVWLDRAQRQIRLTKNRLNFRDYLYPDKGQLPLPPPELWNIQLNTGGPSRQTIQGHDLVMLDYTFNSTLLTSPESIAQAEPALANIGAVWEEFFAFPADPDLLLQRTDNACVNEAGYPPNSYDSENIWHFYNFECTADSGGALGCHRTTLPTYDCRESLGIAVGTVETTIRWERLPWDEQLANQVRRGDVTSWDAPDLSAVADDLANNRVVYKYFDPDDCALEEKAVGDAGWRRLLQFDATVWNQGTEPLHIGKANVEDNENNVFTYNACHDHFHYTNYGDFFLQDQADLTGSKQAFCVQSTVRMSNHETSPLTHEYSCSFQGIQAGWADEYIAGLDAQWVDITELDVPPEGTAVQLGFRSNGDQFLCEGSLLVDENGEPMWEPSGFTTTDGESINRVQCDFVPDWDGNNLAKEEVFVPASGSFVTAPCANNELSPLRNCGFVEVELDEEVVVCEPGTAVEITLPDSFDYPLVARACEWSSVLNSGVACSYESSLFNGIVSDSTEAISFSCPSIRDAEDFEGRFSLYTFTLLEN